MNAPKQSNTGMKIAFLWLLVFMYLGTALVFQMLLSVGVIEKTPPQIVDKPAMPEGGIIPSEDVAFNLDAAKQFLQQKLVKPNGHVDLYWTLDPLQSYPGKEQTNSEAISYYLLWAAQENDKQSFDRALQYMQTYMLQKDLGYMMWRLEADESVQGDGSNVASDADLRAIKALFIAQNQWGDEKYSAQIDSLANALEIVAITDTNLLAPYGGSSGGNSSWMAKEVWLSYVDMTVFRDLAQRRGEPWNSVYNNMKDLILRSQIYNGLYNSMVAENGDYGNGIDAGGYSINSLWIMVRSAESGDPDLMLSANKSLQFYKLKYTQDNVISQSYDSSGNAVIKEDAPWVYALVGRAAILLGDVAFSQDMIEKLIGYQSLDTAKDLGAIFEGDGANKRVGQFTMQESILTMQEYVKNNYQFVLSGFETKPFVRGNESDRKKVVTG